jgi:hypothetical protein
MSNSDEELRRRRNRAANREEDIAKAIRIRRNENKNILLNHVTIRNNYLFAGSCSVLLGEVPRGRREFASAGLYTRAIRQEYEEYWDEIDSKGGVGFHLEFGLYSSILSGHRRLTLAVLADAQRADEVLPSRAHPFGLHRYFRTRALGAIIEENDAKAREWLSQYSEADSEMVDLLVPIHEAMLDDDDVSTRRALRRMTDDHESLFTGGGSGWRSILSHVTAAHLLVARHRGLDVTAAELDNEYVPTGFDEYEFGDEFDLPTPEFVDEDLIPT